MEFFLETSTALNVCNQPLIIIFFNWRVCIVHILRVYSITHKQISLGFFNAADENNNRPCHGYRRHLDE